MRVPTQPSAPSASRPAPAAASSLGFGLLILVLGVLIGAFLDPLRWFGEEEVTPVLTPEEIALQVPVLPAEVREEPPVNDLRTLEIELDPEASRRLQEVHDRSFKARAIVQEEGDLVPATVRADGKTIEAEVRIKGDFLDHIDTDKWSLRVELQSDKLWGMSRFSIQHPKTRKYLWEWFIMEMSRRDGLLAPRADFVNVVMNGNATGIYYLEEHFTKELIESQGRREGPIVRFVEDTLLNLSHQYVGKFGFASSTIAPAALITNAKVAAYGEKRLAQNENLARQLQQALDHMRMLQKDRAGQRTHELLDLRSNALHHALGSLFRTNHSTNWKSRRYYHNPVTGRLEPIVFDTNAGLFMQTRDPLEVHEYTSPAYIKNGRFYRAFFRELGRITEPGYIDDVVRDLFPRLRHYEELMRAEGLEDPMLDAASIEDALRSQQATLYQLLHPELPVSFDCSLLTSDPTAERPSGMLEVEAWATTKVPVILEGFRMGNGTFLPAGSLRVKKGAVERIEGEAQAVALPSDGTHVVFTFRSDEREAVLRDVDQVKRAVVSGGEVDKSLKLSLTAVSRLITESESTEEVLTIRKFSDTWSSEGGRPVPPSVDEALEKHGFLRLDSEGGGLWLEPGTHDVEGDLVVPAGYVLHAGPGTRLRFGATHALISSDALLFDGSAEEPIVLEPRPGVANWSGVAVLQADQKSVWRNVHVRDTDVIRRGGWMMTGGVNFFHAPVELYDCRFDDAHGEDALNIFGVPTVLDGIVIDTVASDAFDGDFVTGVVRNSAFLNSVEDAVDVSGSEFLVEKCRFTAIGDKGISAGEDSTVDVRDCVVESASIGVASKDFSRVVVDGLEIQSAINYGFAVYIKKAEFGPSSIEARNVTLGEMGRGDFIVQSTCQFELEGVQHEGVPVDVKEMYRLKILGQ